MITTLKCVNLGLTGMQAKPLLSLLNIIQRAIKYIMSPMTISYGHHYIKEWVYPYCLARGGGRAERAWAMGPFFYLPPTHPEVFS